MRSVVASALLLFMLLQAAGYLFVFEIQKLAIRREIKQQIKAGVPEDELVLLKFVAEKSDPAFQRVHEREFRYAGKMYDVVRQESRGDTTWYYCIADEKETQLFANLEKMVAREQSQNPARQERLERLLHCFGQLFFHAEEEIIFAAAERALTLRADGFGLKIWIDAPPTPPPEV